MFRISHRYVFLYALAYKNSTNEFRLILYNRTEENPWNSLNSKYILGISF
jgi:hypothetical protein